MKRRQQGILTGMPFMANIASRTFLDDLGRKVYLPHPPRRIVSLAPHITEMLFALGAADHVVAVSEAAFAREPVRDPAILATLHADVGGFDFDAADLTGDVLALTVRRGVFSSNGEARRTIQQGGLSINDRRIERPDERVPQAIDDGWLVVRVGRKRLLVGRRTDR